MKESKTSKSTKPRASEWVNGNDKQLNNFLYPQMPGSFDPYRIRRLPIEKLRDRYIQVFSATMGNHQISKFYCCWSEDKFGEACNESFLKRIEEARGILAGRATYIMHRGMGLVAEDPDKVLVPTITAAIAKVVETLSEPQQGGRSGALNKAYRLTVNGLARPTPSLVPPSVVKRGPGRPRREALSAPEAGESAGASAAPETGDE